MNNTRRLPLIALLTTGFVTLAAFQNCSQVNFEAAKKPLSSNIANGTPTDTNHPTTPTELPPVSICNGVSCDLTPITKKPAVITALLAIGEHVDNQLVIGGGSAQLVAETLVRYSSPVDNPKILAVLDHNDAGENPEDGPYITGHLLTRYNVTVLREPVTGLTDDDVKGYDLIWFNNPGHPMGSAASRDVLLRFKGGVVLQGDDLSQGNGFSVEELTGLHYVNNGTSFTCNGQSYASDNDTAYSYSVSMDPAKIGATWTSDMAFKYGNDIDLTTIARSDLQVLAWAKGAVDGCTEQRPTIVRYEKN